MNSAKMKAIVCTKYGSPEVLQLQKVPKPIPKEKEVLVKIHASSITAADTMMRKGKPVYARLFLGLTKPKNPITGTGFAGVIEAVGEGVSLFKVGEEVFGETVFGFGANAEYTCVAEDGLFLTKPLNVSFAAAATVCDGALTSWNFLKIIGKIQKGQKVLINGASGSLGTAAVQLAKYFGAEVTGVCSAANVELVKSLGADKVIDYMRSDFTQNGETYDLIYDTIGASSFSKCKKALTAKGAYLSPVLSFSLLLQMLRTSIFGSKKAKFSATGMLPVPDLKVYLKELKGLLETEQLKMVMDRAYPLQEVAKAHWYIDTGRKKGNVVAIITDFADISDVADK